MKTAGLVREFEHRCFRSRVVRGASSSFVLACLAALATLTSAAAEPAAESGWSADLLHQILTTETPAPVTPAPLATGQEMVLHTYPLTHLRVGEAGKAQDVLGILRNLLPPGSSMNPDVRANSIHVLTTPAAHKALWDYLSAVDIPAAPAAGSAGLPDDVKAALTKLAAAGDQSDKLLRALSAFQENVSKQFAGVNARQRRQITWVVSGVVAAVISIGALGWMLRRRPAAAAKTDAPDTALALAPDQLASVLMPVQDRMRSDMLGLLNEVAIKLQAQHNEQQKLVQEQQQQLDDARHALADERRQFISEAGTMVVQAVERVDATTAKLARQQDKVAELVQELQNTVRELDETKDNLRHRESELEQERAKIAALSILLEENGGASAAVPTNGHVPEAPRRPPAENSQNGVEPTLSSAVLETLCTTRHHPSATPATDQPVHTNPTAQTDPTAPHNRPDRRFTFLPPDHPET